MQGRRGERELLATVAEATQLLTDEATRYFEPDLPWLRETNLLQWSVDQGFVLASFEQAQAKARPAATLRPFAVVMARYIDTELRLLLRRHQDEIGSELVVDPMMCLAWCVRAGYEFGRLGNDRAVVARLWDYGRSSLTEGGR